MFKKSSGLFAVIAMICLMASNAFAAVVLTGVELDTASPELLAATVLIGLGVIWGIRKLIKLVKIKIHIIELFYSYSVLNTTLNGQRHLTTWSECPLD